MSESKLQEALRRCRGPLWFAGLFSFFINLLMLTVPLYMLQIFDRVLLSSSQETLLYLTLLGVVALLTMGLLEVARSRILVRIGSWLDDTLSPDALNRALEQQLQNRGDRLRAVNDLSAIRAALSGPAIFSLFDAPWVPIYLGVIFLLHPLLGWLATGGAIILLLLGFVNDWTTREPLKRANQLAERNRQQAQMVMRNAEAIDAMGMTDAITRRWRDGTAAVSNEQQAASDRAGILVAISKSTRLSLQLLILGLGAYLVLQNALTAGGMIAASIIMGRALAPVDQMIGNWRTLSAGREAYLRLRVFFARHALRPEGLALPKPKGEISIEDVAYVFPNAEKPTLLGLNFKVAASDSVAVVGPSGSGKSTLLRLIVGALKPSAGVVRLDGADVFGWRRDDFGQYVGYLPQDIELFNGTVRENISRLTDVAESSVLAAADLAGCHEMILRLPKGYDTEIGDSGCFLSVGQRQRIGIARAVFGHPQLIVLDEPNSNLDGEGETALLDMLLKLKLAGKTVIMVTHRPSLIDSVDKMLVLQDASVRAYDNKDVVLGMITPALPAPKKRLFPKIVKG